MEARKRIESVVSIMENPSMPAMWDSAGRGESFEYVDYLGVLQEAPRGVVEVGVARGIIPKDVGENLLALARLSGLKYLYALFCYWKPGRNPDGIDSARPALVYTIEVSNFATTPMLCLFAPRGRTNFGDVVGPDVMQTYLTAMLQALTNGHPEQATRLGDMGVAYKLLTGKEYKSPSKNKGCLGAFLCFVLLSVSFLGMICVAICI